VGGPEENVLGLEVAVDDVHLRKAEKGQGLEDLAGKLADEHEVHALEVGAPEEVVEVEGHVLKHQAGVAIVVKVLKEAHWVHGKRCV